jgi:transcriptional regulator with XRE-family HTH domain
MQLHEKIRFFRRSKGLTQEQMAEKLNITSVAYSNIERGESGVLMTRLEEIAQVMEIDLLDLLSLGEKNVIVLHGDISNSGSYFSQNVTISDKKDTSASELQKDNIIQQQAKEIDYLKQQISDLRNIVELLKEKN